MQHGTAVAAETALKLPGVSLSDILLVLVLCTVGIIFTRIITSVVRKVFSNTAMGEVTLVVNIIRALVVGLMVYIIAENVFHIQLDGIAQALGISTLVVSLGMQDLIKNVVAGVQILVTHLFHVGDQIEVGGIRGEVMDINWRETTLRDKDGDPHVVPNAVLMGTTFLRRDGKMARRYFIECDIKPGLDLDRISDDICRLADEVLDEHGWRAEEHTEVRFLGSTANGVSASIRIFLSDIEYMAPAQDAVMRAIGRRGYLADWTNESPAQEAWR